LRIINGIKRLRKKSEDETDKGCHSEGSIGRMPMTKKKNNNNNQNNNQNNNNNNNKKNKK
jgi:hypothetical protein